MQKQKVQWDTLTRWRDPDPELAENLGERLRGPPSFSTGSFRFLNPAFASSTTVGSECCLVERRRLSACGGRGILTASLEGGEGRHSIGGRNGSQSGAFGDSVGLRELDWGSDWESTVDVMTLMLWRCRFDSLWSKWMGAETIYTEIL